MPDGPGLTAAARSGLQAGTMLGSTYEVGRLIGQGAMGEVYEARHARLSGRFAVKVIRGDVVALDPVTIDRFQREAEVMSTLRHPNVVQIIDFDVTADGSPFIVMEYLEGSDLETRAGQRGPMPVAEVLPIVEQVASALAAAHQLGIIHRDLKPANIFLVPLPVATSGELTEFVKVLDFGISKVKSAESLTETGPTALMGTPHYMAPEQIRLTGDGLDGRADQFSLACVAYELLAGRQAFPGETLEALLYAVVHEQPAPLAAAVGQGIDDVIRKALSKDRNLRFPNVMSFVSAFRAAAAKAGLLGPAAPPGRRGTGDPKASRPSPGSGSVKRPGTSTAKVRRAPLLSNRANVVIIIVSLAAAAVMVGLLLQRGDRALSAPQRAQLVAEVRARVERVLSAELLEVETLAKAAVTIPEVRNAAATRIDALTFNDLFATEDWWRPYRQLATLVFDGDDLLVARGAPDVLHAEGWKIWSRGPGVASAVVFGQERVYLAAGAALANQRSVGLVLGRALDRARLDRMAKGAAVLQLFFSDGKRLYGLPIPISADEPVRGASALAGREREQVVTLGGGRHAIAVSGRGGAWLWAVAGR